MDLVDFDQLPPLDPNPDDVKVWATCMRCDCTWPEDGGPCPFCTGRVVPWIYGPEGDLLRHKSTVGDLLGEPGGSLGESGRSPTHRPVGDRVVSHPAADEPQLAG
jgi:hypothetical protein